MIEEILNHEYGGPRASIKVGSGATPNAEVMKVNDVEAMKQSYVDLRKRQQAGHKESTKKFLEQ